MLTSCYTSGEERDNHLLNVTLDVQNMEEDLKLQANVIEGPPNSVQETIFNFVYFMLFYNIPFPIPKHLSLKMRFSFGDLCAY